MSKLTFGRYLTYEKITWKYYKSFTPVKQGKALVTVYQYGINMLTENVIADNKLSVRSL